VRTAPRDEHPFIKVLLKVPQLHRLLQLGQQLPVLISEHEALAQDGVCAGAAAVTRSHWLALVDEPVSMSLQEGRQTGHICTTGYVPHRSCTTIAAEAITAVAVAAAVAAAEEGSSSRQKWPSRKAESAISQQ
jgi:hypothetical protein